MFLLGYFKLWICVLSHFTQSWQACSVFSVLLLLLMAYTIFLKHWSHKGMMRKRQGAAWTQTIRHASISSAESAFWLSLHSAGVCACLCAHVHTLQKNFIGERRRDRKIGANSISQLWCSKTAPEFLPAAILGRCYDNRDSLEAIPEIWVCAGLFFTVQINFKGSLWQ